MLKPNTSGHRYRKALIMLLALFILLFSFPLAPVSAEITPVTLAIDSVTDKIGSTAEISVTAANFQHISGGNFELVYDPEIADVMASADIIRGSDLNSKFLFSRNNKKSENTLSVAWAGDGTQSVAAGGEICRIRFSLLQTGSVDLRLQNVVLIDASGLAIANIRSVNGSICVEESAGYPDIVINGVSDGANYAGSVIPVVAVSNGSVSELSLTKDNAATASYVSGTPISEPGAYLLRIAATNDSSERHTTAQVYFTIGTSLSVGVASGGVGSTVEIPVIAANFLNIAGGNFELVYDPEFADVLANSDILKGEDLGDGFLFTRNHKKNDNTLSVAWAGDGTQNVVAGGEICRIRFHLLKTGVVNLTLQNVSLKDSKISTISNIALADGRITVEASDAYPGISVTGVTDGSNYNAAVTPVINVSAGSSLTEVFLTKDGGEAANYVSGTAVSDPGTYRLRIKAVNDSSGLSSTVNLNFTIGAVLVVSTVRSKINNTIEITVRAVYFDSIQGGSFDLVYDPVIADVLAKSDIQKGSDLMDEFMFTANNKKASNVLGVAWGATSECIGPGGEICRIRFVTKNIGTAALQLQNVSLKDAELNPIQNVALESGGIQVYEFNNDVALSELNFSGIQLTPGFSKEIKSYTANVDNSVDKTTITANTADPSATVNPADLGIKDLQVGENLFAIRITAEDGVTTGIYTVIITREEKVDECFIATAAFGSKFDAPVVLLREFRDHCLLTNGPGRAFVAFYYYNSPPIARFIADNNILKALVRIVLLPLVGIACLCLHPLIFVLILLLVIPVFWLRTRHNLT